MISGELADENLAGIHEYPQRLSVPEHRLVVPSTRTSGTWTGIGIGLFVLVIVIVFIGQNTKSVPINFLWMHGSFPAGVAVLAAFVLGGIVVLLLGVARLAQLRLLARRHRHDGARRSS